MRNFNLIGSALLGLFLWDKAMKQQTIKASDICQEFLGGCNKSTFWRIRKKDKAFPKPFSLGGHPLWNRADVQEWYDAKRIAQTEAA